jgi:hypothetical protein
MFMKGYVGMAVFITTIILSMAFTATAQETTFDDDVLNNLKAQAEENLDNRILRLTIVEETFENGGKLAASSEKYISETIPPDRSRFITEKKTKNGVVERTEYISIGNQRFIKKHGGNWEIFKPAGGGSGVGSGAGGGKIEDFKIETSSVNKLKRGVTLNKQKTDYYETVTTTKFVYPTRTVVNYSKEGYWFDAKGRYVKAVEEHFSGESKFMRRKTTDYEYDADIKIEAPIK